MEKLGTLIRSQIILQTDSTVVSNELRDRFEFLEALDNIQGIKNKRDYYAKKDPALSKEAQHGTYIVNYTGRLDWGEVANYVESYVIIVEGHLLLEITSMADKIFVSFMQLIKTSKYVNALGNVLDELGIPYNMEGPFEKNIVKHELPE